MNPILTVRPKGNPDALRIMTQSTFGHTKENDPTSDAESNGWSTGAKVPYANTTGDNTRGFIKFVNQLSLFKAMVFFQFSFHGIEPRTHKLNISFITNDFSLSDLTWNNQDTLLTYEDIAAIDPLIGFVSETSLRQDSQVCSTGFGSFGVPSGASMFGARLMVDDEGAYSGSEEAYQDGLSSGVSTRIYY